MRIWNLPTSELDNQHLLGEHLELHVLWSVITRGGRGWSHHPETARWRGRLGALYQRHEEQVAEMQRRGMLGHKTPLDRSLIGPEESWERPTVTDADLEKDRADLIAHFPGWRRAAGRPERTGRMRRAG